MQFDLVAASFAYALLLFSPRAVYAFPAGSVAMSVDVREPYCYCDFIITYVLL
jgi:hypothetical protein